MTVQSTSLGAYFRLQQTGIPDTQRDMILLLLRYAEEPMTNREIAAALGLEPSTASARRNELMKRGLIRLAGRRRCSISGYTALTYGWRGGVDAVSAATRP